MNNFPVLNITNKSIMLNTRFKREFYKNHTSSLYFTIKKKGRGSYLHISKTKKPGFIAIGNIYNESFGLYIPKGFGITNVKKECIYINSMKGIDIYKLSSI